jgi:hypothetical protein
LANTQAQQRALEARQQQAIMDRYRRVIAAADNWLNPPQPQPTEQYTDPFGLDFAYLESPPKN